MRDGYQRGVLPPQATRRQMDVLAAYVAAGSALTGDVEPGQIAVARGRQKNVDGWVARARAGTATEAAARAATEAGTRHTDSGTEPTAEPHQGEV